MKKIMFMLSLVLVFSFAFGGIDNATTVSAKTIKVNSQKPTNVKLKGKIIAKKGYSRKIYYLKFSKKITFKDKKGENTQKQKEVEIYTDNSKNPKKWNKYLKKHKGKKVTLSGQLAVGEYDYVLFMK